MSTELNNGVIIPEEYSDDWYDEMSINLRKLNDVITAASDNATDIQRLDTDKANQSDLTALTSRVSQNETDIIALQTAVSGALKREIVQTLPTEDISTTTIYMIRNSQSSGTNIYDEYMYINSQWELIGTSATDFSNYYTKNETDNLLSAKANQTDLTSLSGRVTQNETDITALQTAVSGALKREIVQSLPTQDISTTTIYMIRNTTTSGDNIYDEYMYINNLWELIGTSATDFSNYYTKTEIDTLLSGKQASLSQTQLDAVNSGIDSSKVQQIATNTSDISSLQSGKANDSDVVHKSGNETISGVKTFTDVLTASRNVSNGEIILKNASYDPKTNGQGGVSTKSFSVNFVTALSDTFGAVSCYGINNKTMLRFTCRYFVDSQNVKEDSLEYSVYSDETRSFKPRNNNNCLLGESTRKWKDVQTYQINALEPSSLSLPSGTLSNQIDISSYFSNTGSGDTNSYTASANGWIYLRLGDIDSCQATVYDANNNRMWGQSSTGSVEQMTIPILKGQTLSTQWSTGSTVNVVNARFIPCQGNI